MHHQTITFFLTIVFLLINKKNLTVTKPCRFQKPIRFTTKKEDSAKAKSSFL
jgi:hypothetical protein